EQHTRPRRLLTTLDEIRGLMGGPPDSVAGAVDELLAIPGVGDNGPGDAVDLLARHSRPHGLEGGLLRPPDDVMHLQHVRRRLPDGHRAGRVRPVPVHQAPKSSTTVSPGWINRSPASWCGLAPWGRNRRR